MDVSYIFIRPIADTIKRNKRRRAAKQSSYTLNKNTMWSRGFLYTFWVIQICLCVLGWALAAFSFGLRRAGGGSFNQNLKTALKLAISLAKSFGVMANCLNSVHGAIWVTWATVCFVLIVTQWTMFSKNRLRPWFAVTSNTIMSILWLILFAIAIYSIANDGGSALQPVILGIYQ